MTVSNSPNSSVYADWLKFKVKIKGAYCFLASFLPFIILFRYINRHHVAFFLPDVARRFRVVAFTLNTLSSVVITDIKYKSNSSDKNNGRHSDYQD